MDYMKEYFKTVSPTYMENWYDMLKELTIPSEYFRLTKQEAKSILKITIIHDEDGMKLNLMQHLHDIEKKFEDCYFKLGKQYVFIRLGSRSPKDNPRQNKFTALPPNKMEIFESERVIDDILLALDNDYEPYLFLREYKNIDRKDEFRVFVKDGEVKGISQYFYAEVFDELQDAEYRKQIENGVLELHKKMGAFKLKDYIFDVWKDGDRFVLLEINPYSSWTDPCLFDWATDDFEQFEFRINEERQKKAIL